MSNPRDAWYLDEAVAILVAGPNGAETLRRALTGHDLRTPAFLSDAGPVLLFATPEGTVRGDLSGVTLFKGDELPALRAWLQDSEGLPLAPLPRAFLVDAEESATPLTKAAHIAPPAEKGDLDQLSSQYGMKLRRAPVHAIDAPIRWRAINGRLTIIEAPIDPQAIPSERQEQAFSLLMGQRHGDEAVRLSDWRDACRSTWQMSAGAGLTAFKRTVAVLIERGAIRVEGELVHVVSHSATCRDPIDPLSRSESGATAPCRARIEWLSKRLTELLRFDRVQTRT